jgi:hypothetical protein
MKLGRRANRSSETLTQLRAQAGKADSLEVGHLGISSTLVLTPYCLEGSGDEFILRVKAKASELVSVRASILYLTDIHLYHFKIYSLGNGMH